MVICDWKCLFISKILRTNQRDRHLQHFISTSCNCWNWNMSVKMHCWQWSHLNPMNYTVYHKDQMDGYGGVNIVFSKEYNQFIFQISKSYVKFYGWSLPSEMQRFVSGRLLQATCLGSILTRTIEQLT